LRFNDRISMRVSTELREPFLDHRLVELAMRQSPERKINESVRKWLLRRLTRQLLCSQSSKRPNVPCKHCSANGCAGLYANGQSITTAVRTFAGSWLDAQTVRAERQQYCASGDNNNFFMSDNASIWDC
jgi:asparagine synthase (glutamine-hydrolysing)